MPPQNEWGGGVERKLIGSEVKELGNCMLNIPCPQSNDEEKEWIVMQIKTQRLDLHTISLLKNIKETRAYSVPGTLKTLSQ